MMVIYGDYKDMDNVQPYENGRPANVSAEEMEALRPYWEKFISGGLNLVERRPRNEEVARFCRIDIRNDVFTENEYTSYAVNQPPTERHAYSVMRLCREADQCFVDTENGVIVTESERIESGSRPQSLEVLKEREAKWEEKLFARMYCGPIEGLPAETHSEILDKIVAKKRCWEEKTAQRWFHPTLVASLKRPA